MTSHRFRLTTRVARTVHMGVRPRPAAAQNAEKSCRPRTRRSPSAIACSSSAWARCHAYRRPNGSAGTPRSITYA